MTRNDFLIALQDILQVDAPLEETTILTDMEEWDSLAYMALIAFFDRNWGVHIVFADLNKCHSPADLIKLSQGNVA